MTMDDTSVLLVELSIFWYVVGLLITSILKVVTLHCPVRLTIPAADRGESVTLTLFVVSITIGPILISNEAPITVVTLPHGFGCVMTRIESLLLTL